MSVSAITALITGITSLVAAITALIVALRHISQHGIDQSGTSASPPTGETTPRIRQSGGAPPAA